MHVFVQPDNPAEFSGKIYEMMATSLSDKLATLDAQQPLDQQPLNPEIVEAEIVEPVEAGNQK